MSHCEDKGKDKVIFLTKEDLEQPSKALIHEFKEDDEEPGLILPSGDINWSCPCLGGMASGPCGLEFREAFSCFHYSKAEMKGSDCIDSFRNMQECMAKYPDLYPDKDDKPDEDDGHEPSTTAAAIPKEKPAGKS